MKDYLYQYFWSLSTFVLLGSDSQSLTNRVSRNYVATNARTANCAQSNNCSQGQKMEPLHHNVKIHTLCSVIDFFKTRSTAHFVNCCIDDTRWTRGWVDTVGVWACIAWLRTHEMDNPVHGRDDVDASKVHVLTHDHGIDVTLCVGPQSEGCIVRIRWDDCVAVDVCLSSLGLLRDPHKCPCAIEQDVAKLVASAADNVPDWWNYALCDVQRAFACCGSTATHAQVTSVTLSSLHDRVERWVAVCREFGSTVFIVTDTRQRYADLMPPWLAMVNNMMHGCGFRCEIVGMSTQIDAMPPSRAPVVAIHNVVEYMLMKAKTDKEMTSRITSWNTFVFGSEHYNQRSYLTDWSQTIFRTALLFAEYDPLSADHLRNAYGNCFWFPSIAGQTPSRLPKTTTTEMQSDATDALVECDVLFVGKNRHGSIAQFRDDSCVRWVVRETLDSSTFDSLHSRAMCSFGVARGACANNAFLLCRNLRTIGLPSVVVHAAACCNPCATMCYRDLALHVWNRADVEKCVRYMRTNDTAAATTRRCQESSMDDIVSQCASAFVARVSVAGFPGSRTSSIVDSVSFQSLAPQRVLTMSQLPQLKHVLAMTEEVLRHIVYIFADDCSDGLCRPALLERAKQVDSFVQGLPGRVIMCNRSAYELFGHHPHVSLRDFDNIHDITREAAVVFVVCVCGSTDSETWVQQKFEHATGVYPLRVDQRGVECIHRREDMRFKLRHAVGLTQQECALLSPFRHREGRQETLLLHGLPQSAALAHVRAACEHAGVSTVVQSSVDTFSLVHSQAYFPCWFDLDRPELMEVQGGNVWHAFSCATLVLLPDLRKYAICMPFPLVAHVHYVPVDLDDPCRALRTVRDMTFEQRSRIANRGKEYVLACYDSATVSRYVLHACLQAHLTLISRNVLPACMRPTGSVSAVVTSAGKHDERRVRAVSGTQIYEHINATVTHTPWRSNVVVGRGRTNSGEDSIRKINCADEEQYWYAFAFAGSNAPQPGTVALPTTSGGVPDHVHVWVDKTNVPCIADHEPIAMWICTKKDHAPAEVTRDTTCLIAHEWNEERDGQIYRSWALRQRAYGLQRSAHRDLWRFDIRTLAGDDCNALRASSVISLFEDATMSESRMPAEYEHACFYAVAQRKRRTHFIVFKRCNAPLYVWDDARSAMDEVPGWHECCEVRAVGISKHPSTREQRLLLFHLEHAGDDVLGYVLVPRRRSTTSPQEDRVRA